jgi:pimeloyl-ACP methyl ester carboxylesterase
MNRRGVEGQMSWKLLTVLVATMLCGLALSSSAQAICRPPGEWTDFRQGDLRLRARVVGRGPPVLVIPSLGRGPADFDALSAFLVERGYAVVAFEPRWFGASSGPADVDLIALADDASYVLDKLCPGSQAVVIGHAHGNRVARALATQHSDQVHSLILLASGGQQPIPPAIVAAIGDSAAEGRLPDAQRLAALQTAFFAKGHDPGVWLRGWSPQAAERQQAANRRTKDALWQAGGSAPILVVQAMEDPVAPIENALALKALAPDRVRIVRLARASHAMLPEQPKAIARVVDAFLAGTMDERRLQAVVDQNLAP